MISLPSLIESGIAAFDKKFTQSHPGDSGMGGNDPQEPVYEWAAGPQDVKAFIASLATKAHNAAIEAALEALPEFLSCTFHSETNSRPEDMCDQCYQIRGYNSGVAQARAKLSAMKAQNI